MSGSSRRMWFAFFTAVVIWHACIVLPGLSLLGIVFNESSGSVQSKPMLSLLGTSIGWALAVALGAVICGWLPGRLLGRVLAAAPLRRFILLAGLIFLPVMLPSYIVFYAWWQSWPADSAIHQWVIERGWMQQARHATLLLSLVCWSWPLVSWCVAAAAANAPVERDELLRIDGAGPIRRALHHLRDDARMLAVGALLVFLATLANTTCFDLAEVFTFANELRAMQALNAPPKELLVAALPCVVLSGSGGLAVWILLSHNRIQSRTKVTATRMQSVGVGTFAFTLIVWCVSAVLPVVLLVRTIVSRESWRLATQEFFTLYGGSVAITLLNAAVSALIAAMLAVILALAWMDERIWVRRAASIIGCTFLLAAVMPGTLIGLSLQRSYNHPAVQDAILMTPVALVLGHLMCFGFVAALMARWMAGREPRQLSDLRRLDDVRSLLAMLHAGGPRIIAAAGATFIAVFVMAIGEIPVTAMIHPPHRPGYGPLTLTLLNDMHYQRPQTVMIAAIGMVALAMLASFVLALVWRGTPTRNIPSGWRANSASAKAMAIGLWVLTMTIGGCTPDDPNVPQPLEPELVFGSPGLSKGQFSYPRAIDVDSVRKVIYVIDKQARVQRFGFDGKVQAMWHMPESANGKPTGVSVASDGRVFVADTHYFRVIAYDADGHELHRFGEFGRGPGQFIYVTDVAIGPDDRLYVAEYGGNDRIQVFDSSGHYLFEFSDLGEPHGRFNRPQAIAFNADRSELYIADACNHRIVVVNPQGQFLRSFGSAGRGTGQLTYPYGLTVLEDGGVIVAEFGNNRVQSFDRNGHSTGLFGTLGRGEGQVMYPWSVASTNDRVFVLDSGNNRVQVISIP